MAKEEEEAEVAAEATVPAAEATVPEAEATVPAVEVAAAGVVEKADHQRKIHVDTCCLRCPT